MAAPFLSWSQPGQGIRTPQGGGGGANLGNLPVAGGGTGDFLNAFVRDKGNLLNRLSAYERNFVDHDLGLAQQATQRQNINTQRSNLLDQIASQNRNVDVRNQTQRYGIDQDFKLGDLTSQRNLTGTKYSADRGAQAQLGSAGIAAQANMLGPMLQQQRFNTLAPHVLGALGSLGQGSSNLSQALMGGQ